MYGICSLTRFKILAKKLPPLTTFQVNTNSYKRIIKEIKKTKEIKFLPPHIIALQEKWSYVAGVGFPTKK
jgi:hypothetical protein